RALSSREQIKEYAVQSAERDLADLTRLARAGSDEDISARYAPLVAAARQNLSYSGRPAPSRWTAAALVSAFPVKSEQGFVLYARPLMEQTYREAVLKMKRRQAQAVKLGLDLSGGTSVVIKADLSEVTKGVPDAERAAIRSEAMALVLSTLENRINRFGLSEPVIRRQGEDRVYVEIPGLTDRDRVHSIVMGRGVLAFHLVDDDATQKLLDHYRNNPQGTFDAAHQLHDLSLVPEHTSVLGVYRKDSYGLDVRDGFLVVKKEPALEGRHIRDATVSSGRANEPLVLFDLDHEGARIFSELTTKEIGRRLAIVSDGKIRSAPAIREPITAGSGSISGFSAEEAQNLKTALRSAWLNVALEIENQQVVGASMGEESIRQGTRALVWGLCAVLLFMLVWYQEAGVNACVAQLLNLYIMFGVLSAFNLTLTLSSIAGMILTIGMAVDANVVVFERIREELALGKSRGAAVCSGFERAFWAIMDSNVTTFIAALFLSVLGTGPIKGFAYSLAIGVVSSVFTALFVSRLMFDYGTEVLHKKTVRIGWRIARV
ncbi:protein translocase subunit SecD, partial [Treponema pallidum]